MDQHFAFPNVVISRWIICLPSDGCCISTHSISISPLGANCPQFHRSLPIGPQNCHYRHTLRPLQKNNQHAVCAACGHTATKLGLWSLSKTITPLAGAVYTSNLEAWGESVTIWRRGLGGGVFCYLAAKDHSFFVLFHCCLWSWAGKKVKVSVQVCVCVCGRIVIFLTQCCHRWQASC